MHAVSMEMLDIGAQANHFRRKTHSLQMLDKYWIIIPPG